MPPMRKRFARLFSARRCALCRSRRLTSKLPASIVIIGFLPATGRPTPGLTPALAVCLRRPQGGRRALGAGRRLLARRAQQPRPPGAKSQIGGQFPWLYLRSVIAPAVRSADHSAGMTDGGSCDADTIYSGPTLAAPLANLRDHALPPRGPRKRY